MGLLAQHQAVKARSIAQQRCAISAMPTEPLHEVQCQRSHAAVAEASGAVDRA